MRGLPSRSNDLHTKAIIFVIQRRHQDDLARVFLSASKRPFLTFDNPDKLTRMLLRATHIDDRHIGHR